MAPQLQNSFLQSVFNEISLEREPKLWQSAKDIFIEKRISFLSQFQQTRFEPQLGKERPQLQKNEPLSKAFKAKGQAALKAGDLDKGVALLNAALCLSPNKSELTASIYQTRATAFKSGKKFFDALYDLTEAADQIECVENRHDSNRCIEINQDEKFLEMRLDMFTECLKHKSDKVDENLMEKYRKALSDNESSVLLQMQSDLIHQSRLEIPEQIASVNPKFTSFSECVQIEETPTQGRYTVAARDIKPGELLAIDQPVVTYLDAEFSKSHCWHCLGPASRILPCSSCSGIVFCSRGCKIKGETTYHRYECGLIDILYQSEIGVWILALRAVASRPREYFTSNDFHTVAKRQTSSSIDKDFEFEQLCKLVTHEGSNKFVAPELMKEALVAVFLTRILARKDYFLTRSGFTDSFGSDECKVALWIHYLMRIARFNSHEMTELSPKVSMADAKLHTRRIGVACNPNLALINHACDPNYGRVWIHSGPEKRPTIYAYSTRPIRKNEEICDAYSGVFSMAGKEDRDIVHQRYHFQCECIACKNDWPMLKQLSSQIPKATKNDDKAKKLSQIVKSKTKILSKSPAEQLRWSIDALTLADSVLKRPHPVFLDLEEDVHKSLWFVAHSNNLLLSSKK